MARLDRETLLSTLFQRADWDVNYSPIPEWIDSDSAIDTFGRLAKADITNEMLEELIEADVFTQDARVLDYASVPDFKKMFDVKHIKSEYKKLHKEVKEVAEEVATKEVKVEPMQISIDAALGAMGKAIGESLVGEYGELMAEAAKPFIKKFVKDEYGHITKTVKIVVPERGETEGVFHEVFEKVLKYVCGNFPVMLVGEAGTGKNVICEQISEALGLPFYFMNKVSDEYQLKGFMDANGNYVETPFYRAQKNGGVFMLDEMDASSEDALEVLHTALSNKYMTYPNGEFVRNHKDFRVLAGCNTFGTGATYMYTGRRQLDGATLNRFMTVKVDYSPTIEESLTDDAELLAFIRKFRKCCKEFGINHIVSYRNIIQLDTFVDVVGIDEILRDGLLKNLEKDDLTMLQGRFDGDNDRWSLALKRCMA